MGIEKSRRPRALIVFEKQLRNNQLAKQNLCFIFE